MRSEESPRSDSTRTRQFFGGLLAILGALDVLESLIVQRGIGAARHSCAVAASVVPARPEPEALQVEVRDLVGAAPPGSAGHRGGTGSTGRPAAGAPAADVPAGPPAWRLRPTAAG